MNNTVRIIVLIVTFAAGFFLNQFIRKDRVRIEYVEKDPIVIEKVVAKLDTIWENVIVEKIISKLEKDTVYLEPKYSIVAKGDTTFEDFGKVFGEYHFSPKNYFNFKIDPIPQKIIYVDPKWYETRTFGFIAGAVFTGGIFYLTKPK